jgi:hypothetical protein
MKSPVESSIEIPETVTLSKDGQLAKPQRSVAKSQSGSKKAKNKKHSKHNTFDLPAIVTQFASDIVKVGGKDEELAKVLIRSVFVRAIKGNKSALKTVLKWADTYFSKPEAMPPEKVFPSFLKVTQEDVDFWKKNGFLPSNCPSLLKDIPFNLLNGAAKKSKKAAAKGTLK